MCSYAIFIKDKDACAFHNFVVIGLPYWTDVVLLCIEYKKWSLQYFSLDITFIYMNCKKDNFCTCA